MGAQQAKAAGKTIPPDKLQEMVRTEVDRILREQGLGGFVSQGKAGRLGRRGPGRGGYPRPGYAQEL